MDDNSLLFMIALLVGFFGVIISKIWKSINNTIDQYKWNTRYDGVKGIYLTANQIEDIKSRRQLPQLSERDIPINLSSNEVCVYCAEADLIRRNRYYQGIFLITTNRVVFVNQEKGCEIQNKKIVAFLVTDNGISIQSGRSVFQFELAQPQLVKKVFNAVIKNSIPLEQKNLKKKSKFNKNVVYKKPTPVVNNGDTNQIDQMNGHQFEYFCAGLLEKNGFYNVEVTPGSGDQGVDILAEKDSIKYAIQCKHYSSPLSNTPIQEVNAGKIFYKCHVAAVMTNSTFTQGAIDLAQSTGVLLWDGNKLNQLMQNL